MSQRMCRLTGTTPTPRALTRLTIDKLPIELSSRVLSADWAKYYLRFCLRLCSARCICTNWFVTARFIEKIVLTGWYRHPKLTASKCLCGEFALLYLCILLIFTLKLYILSLLQCIKLRSVGYADNPSVPLRLGTPAPSRRLWALADGVSV